MTDTSRRERAVEFIKQWSGGVVEAMAAFYEEEYGSQHRSNQSMRVEISLKETSQNIVHEDATNAYTKGPMYCVYESAKNRVCKYPMSNVWRVVEEYTPESLPVAAREK